jgi:diguanylate cyclase (GGDEF)-like protein
MGNKKILLLDTEKNVLLTYQTVLKEEGYQVDIATSEKEAIEKLSNQSYAILITELYLKGNNTTNLVKQTKQYHPETYIIMVTAISLISDIYEEIINAGVDDYFTKPFSSKGLLVNIKKGLKRRALVLKNVQLEDRLRKMEHLFSSDPYYSDENKVICNNLYFRKRLQDEIMRAKRYNHQFSLVLFDINHSDNENKQNISNEVSKIILKNTRQTDVITRHNGSFALILLETSNDGTKILTGRLQDQIINTPFIKDKPHYQQIIKNFKIDHISYPDQSEFIHKWVSEAEKKWDN